MDQVKTGKFIAELRKEHGLTQEQLGEKLLVTNKTVSRWETGKYMPDIDMLQLLGKAFNISVDELLAGQRLLEKPHGEQIQESPDAVHVSPFTREEHEIYWKRKWRTTHIWAVIFCIALTLSAFIFIPKLFGINPAVTWCFFPLAAIIGAAVYLNKMQAYVDDKLYSESIIFAEKTVSSKFRQESPSVLLTLHIISFICSVICTALNTNLAVRIIWAFSAVAYCIAVASDIRNLRAEM